MAQLTHRPLEEITRQALEAGVPPLPDNLPAPMRDDLMALEDLSDEALLATAQSQLTADRIASHHCGDGGRYSA